MSVTRIADFDTWRPGYNGATVRIYLAGTTTLASVFTDEALSVSAANPQTLSSITYNNISYGKFVLPLYIGAAYELDIVSMDQTGVIRVPLTSLTGENAGAATVIPSGGSVANTLSVLTGRTFYVEDTAALGISSATNSATLTTSLGRAATAGGGESLLPDNTAIVFNQLTIPNGVVARGRGRSGSPTVIQSQVADKVLTLNDGSGIKNLVLDGINKTAGGIGAYSKAKVETLFDNVLIKRLETGIQQVGGRRANWKDLYIDACSTGAKLQGSLDTSGGDLFTNNRWTGGKVSNCTTYGVQLAYVDKVVSNVEFNGVGFEDNTGTALSIEGARFVRLNGCHFSGNTTNLALFDNALTSVTDNTIRSFEMVGGSITGGAITFDGSCRDVVFKRVDFSNVHFTLTNVTGNVTFIDCKEDSLVTFTGQGTRITRIFEELGDAPGSAVTTTDATALKAWDISLEPGQKVWLESKVVGVQRNGVNYGFYHIARAVHRPGSNLLYKAQVTNFTVGALLTGTTSGATARIIGDTDAGVTGTLIVKNIVGVFLDNEPLTDSSGGAATCDGVLVPQNAALLGSLTSIEAAVETVAGYGADYVVSSGNIELQVTGAAAATIDWTANTIATVN